MTRCRITVLKRMLNKDITEEYCNREIMPCEKFYEGQGFIIEDWERPEDFCEWAWNDMHQSYRALMTGDASEGWMKDEGTLIYSCTDGLRPVVFKIERLKD